MKKEHKMVQCKIETTNKLNNQITMTCGKRFKNIRGSGANNSTKSKQNRQVHDHIIICKENEEW